MQKLAVKLGGLALLCGLVGAALRLWELKTVFEAETGLAKPHALPSMLLIALCLLFAVLLLLGTLRLRGLHAGKTYGQALHSEGPFVPILALVLFAVTLVGAFLCYRAGVASGERLSMGILALFAAAAGLSWLALSRQAAQRRDGAENCLCCVLITLFLCYWLILSYKESAADPVLLNYVYDFLALCAGALASYYLAGYAFDRARLARCVFFSLFSAAFSIIALPGQPLYNALFYVFLALYLLTNSIVLLHNAHRPRRAEEALIAEPFRAAVETLLSDFEAQTDREFYDAHDVSALCPDFSQYEAAKAQIPGRLLVRLLAERGYLVPADAEETPNHWGEDVPVRLVRFEAEGEPPYRACVPADAELEDFHGVHVTAETK